MKLRAIALLFGCWIAAGCGGGPASILDNPSRFRGDWGGSWTSGTLQDGGSIDLVIGADGVIGGTMESPALSTATGSVAGRVGSDGNFTASAVFDNGVYDLSGGMFRQSNRITITFLIRYNGVDYGASGTMDLKSGGGS